MTDNVLAVSSEERRPLAARSRVSLLGACIFLYVISTVLFATKSSTYLIADAVGFGLAFVYIAQLFAHRRLLRIPVPLVCLGVFICYCTLQMAWAPGAGQLLATLMQLFVLSTIIVTFEADQDHSLVIELALYGSIIATFIYTLASHEVSLGGRYGSTLVNANAYAEVLMYGALIALRRAVLESVKGTLTYKKLLPLLGFYGLTLYGIAFLTGSRKGIILVVLGSVLIIWYWVWQQPPQYRILIMILVAAVFAGVAFGLYQSPQAKRLVYLGNFLQGSGTVDTSLLLRDDLIKEAVRVWLQKPFTGWGLGMFQSLSAYGLYAHDNYLELLANDGLIGLVCYLMIYITTFGSLLRSLWRSQKGPLRVDMFWGLVVIIMFVVWDTAAVSYYEKVPWIMLSLVIGIAVRARRLQRQAAEKIEPVARTEDLPVFRTDSSERG